MSRDLDPNGDEDDFKSHHQPYSFAFHIFLPHPTLKFTQLYSFFWPLDEAISSRAVIVIVSGREGQAETFLEPANNSKTVGDRPYVSIGS